MGQSLSIEQLEQLKEETTFNNDDIKLLYKKFLSLDSDKSSGLSLDEFLTIPELSHNPLVKRIFHTIDVDNNGEIDFHEFITSFKYIY